MSHSLVVADYHGLHVSFNEDGWFNATKAAEKFGKRPNDWLQLDETKEYISILFEILNTSPNGICSHKVSQNHFVKTRRGRHNGGTWLHPDLAVAFARWLDLRFAVWCDRQIRSILSGTHPHFNWKRIRHEASASNKVMNEALRIVREAQGKEANRVHYINEARLVNWALTGEFNALERESLSESDLSVLAKLEIKNSVMLGHGFPYQDRKTALQVYAAEIRQPLVTGNEGLAAIK